nr:MAG: ORF3 [Culex pipiens-associated Tunisia virus]
MSIFIMNLKDTQMVTYGFQFSFYLFLYFSTMSYSDGGSTNDIPKSMSSSIEVIDENEITYLESPPTFHLHISKLPNTVIEQLSKLERDSSLNPEILSILKFIVPNFQNGFNTLLDSFGESNSYEFNLTNYLSERISSAKNQLKTAIDNLHTHEILHTLYHIGNQSIDVQNTLNEIKEVCAKLSCPDEEIKTRTSSSEIIDNLLKILGTCKNKITDEGTPEREQLEKIISFSVPGSSQDKSIPSVIGEAVPHVLDFFSSKTKLAGDVVSGAINSTSGVVSDYIKGSDSKGCSLSVGDINCNCKDKDLSLPNVSGFFEDKKSSQSTPNVTSTNCNCSCDYKQVLEEFKNIMDKKFENITSVTKPRKQFLNSTKFQGLSKLIFVFDNSSQLYLNFSDLPESTKDEILDIFDEIDFELYEPEKIIQYSDTLYRQSSKLRRVRRAVTLKPPTPKPTINPSYNHRQVINQSKRKNTIENPSNISRVNFITQSIEFRRVLNNLYDIEKLLVVSDDNLTYYHNQQKYKTREELVGFFLSNFTVDQSFYVLDNFLYDVFNVSQLVRIHKRCDIEKIFHLDEYVEYINSRIVSSLKDDVISEKVLRTILNTIFKNSGIINRYFKLVKLELENQVTKKFISDFYIKGSPDHLISSILDIYFMDNRNLKIFLDTFREKFLTSKDKGFIINHGFIKMSEISQFSSNSYLTGYKITKTN